MGNELNRPGRIFGENADKIKATGPEVLDEYNLVGRLIYGETDEPDSLTILLQKIDAIGPKAMAAVEEPLIRFAEYSNQLDSLEQPWLFPQYDELQSLLVHTRELVVMLTTQPDNEVGISNVLLSFPMRTVWMRVVPGFSESKEPHPMSEILDARRNVLHRMTCAIARIPRRLKNAGCSAEIHQEARNFVTDFKRQISFDLRPREDTIAFHTIKWSRRADACIVMVRAIWAAMVQKYKVSGVLEAWTSEGWVPFRPHMPQTCITEQLAFGLSLADPPERQALEEQLLLAFNWLQAEVSDKLERLSRISPRLRFPEPARSGEIPGDLITSSGIAKLWHLKDVKPYRKKWPDPVIRKQGRSPAKWSWAQLAPVLRKQRPHIQIPDELPDEYRYRE